jgi:hypothetical protein
MLKNVMGSLSKAVKDHLDAYNESGANTPQRPTPDTPVSTLF